MLLKSLLPLALLIAPAAIARPITDPIEDYTAIAVEAARQPDLDVLSVDALFNGTTFNLSSTLAGTVGTTANGEYVWGVNRGAGAANFGPLAPGVLFDAVVVAFADGTGFAFDFGSAAPVALAPGSVHVSGTSIDVRVPLADLPTTGFTGTDYGFNLWPRLIGGDTTNISDFAPDNSTFKASLVPEPAAFALLGVGALGLIARRRLA